MFRKRFNFANLHKNRASNIPASQNPGCMSRALLTTYLLLGLEESDEVGTVASLLEASKHHLGAGHVLRGKRNKITRQGKPIAFCNVALDFRKRLAFMHQRTGVAICPPFFHAAPISFSMSTFSISLSSSPPTPSLLHISPYFHPGPPCALASTKPFFSTMIRLKTREQAHIHPRITNHKNHRPLARKCRMHKDDSENTAHGTAKRETIHESPVSYALVSNQGNSKPLSIGLLRRDLA